MLERFWLGCGRCHGGETCPVAQELNASTPPRDGLAALPVPLTAIAVFLLPLACAIAAGYLAGQLRAAGSQSAATAWQAGGTLAGLAAGIGAARLLVRAMFRVRTWLSRGRE